MKTILRDFGYLKLFTLFLALLFGCGHSTEPDQPTPVYSSPEDVVENLVSSYNGKDLERYLSSFREDSRFGEGLVDLWGKDVEEKIHKRLFANVKQIDLEMSKLRGEGHGSSEPTGVYHYRLSLIFPTEQIIEAQGEVECGFMQNEQGSWQISSIHEGANGLRKVTAPEANRQAVQDSVDYFPLTVGNQWTYEDVIPPEPPPDVTTVVTDSVMIHDQLYYSLIDVILPYFMRPSLVRVDTLDQLHQLIGEDSTDLVIFNFRAIIGDSMIIEPPDNSEIVVVELISRKDSVRVPAGRFDDVLEFLVTDFNSGSNFIYEFAADVGMIRQSGTNQELLLKSALVDGNVITTVNTHYFSWTQIKKNYF